MRIQTVESQPFHTVPYIVGSATAVDLPFFRASVDILPDGLEAIIATGDLQGVTRAGCRSQSTRLLGEALALELQILRDRGELPPKEKTAVLLVGDLHPFAGVDDVRSVWFALGDMCRWVAGVAGNHDAFGPGQRGADISACLNRPDLHFFDDRIERIGTLVVGGLSGIVGTAGEPWVRTETAFAEAIGRLARCCPDVLITHDGPNVSATALTGWPNVRESLESAPPTLLFRGHDAWEVPLAVLRNGTQIVNVEGRVLVLN